MIHSSVNEVLLFINLRQSGRGEVSTGAGWFIGGRIIPCGSTGREVWTPHPPLVCGVQDMQVVVNARETEKQKPVSF